jgi:hypothetical protein
VSFLLIIVFTGDTQKTGEPGSKIISPILILRVLSAYPVTPDERLAGISEENIKKSSNF